MSPKPPHDVFSKLEALAGLDQPLLLILVGPNGAGKSTFHRRYLEATSLPFVNADVLARTLVQSGAPAGRGHRRGLRRLFESSAPMVGG